MSGLCGSISGAATTVGSLGFRGAGCCRAPCPSFPLHHVVICMEINACTSVQIDVGCPGAVNCAPTWVYGTPQDSWGRQFRTVQFDQHVQDGAFIRITTCAKSPCSDCANCGLGAVDTIPTPDTYPGANKLLKYLVDGQDITRYLAAVHETSTHTDDCVYVGCADRSAQIEGCCNYSSSGFDTLNQIPWGSEITVGPVGARSFVLPLPL